jgi:nicotinate-nucleotide adenylyltransferase
MRVGVFGGTFDPAHVGHLILAEQARDQARLDEVWFVVASSPPQKQGQQVTRFETRVEMLQLALAGNPSFRIEEVEKERPGPSYTVDTLAELRRRHPDVEFLLLMGGDSLADLPQWYQPLRILEQAGLVVMARPGVAHPTPEELRRQLGMPEGTPLRLGFVEAPEISIASRALRRAVSEGRSIRYLVPRAVEMYIAQHGLYKGA